MADENRAFNKFLIRVDEDTCSVPHRGIVTPDHDGVWLKDFVRDWQHEHIRDNPLVGKWVVAENITTAGDLLDLLQKNFGSHVYLFSFSCDDEKAEFGCAYPYNTVEGFGPMAVDSQFSSLKPGVSVMIVFTHHPRYPPGVLSPEEKLTKIMQYTAGIFDKLTVFAEIVDRLENRLKDKDTTND